MTNDEINRYIHTQIMGNRPEHSWEYAQRWHDGELKQCCSQCQMLWTAGNGGTICSFPIVPDYCSDSSPRSLLNEVVAKVRGFNQEELAQKVSKATAGYGVNYYTPLDALELTAEQIARACVEAHKAADPPPQAEGQGEVPENAITDGCGGIWGIICPECSQPTMQVVRPGKGSMRRPLCCNLRVRPRKRRALFLPCLVAERQV